MTRSLAPHARTGGLLLAACALALAAGGSLLPEPALAQQQQNFGEVTVTASTLDYDLGTRQVLAVGKVVLVSRNSKLNADKMTVQLTPKRELEWAKCEGGVFVEKKDPQDGTVTTGRGDTLDYSETGQKADLRGDVTVNQSSPRLAKPAVVTGSRVEMNLATKDNTVYRSDKAQAKVHVEPKGQEGKPTPEPVDTVADKIEMKGATQEYICTGKPVMVRPTSRLQAKRIRWQVEGDSQDVKVAYADDDVVFDGQGQNGSVVHATGDNGVYNRESNEIVLTGSVHATTKDPDDEKPTVYQGDKFTYNTVTRRTRLLAGEKPGAGPAIVTIPEGKAPGAPKPGGDSAGTDKPAADKGGKDGDKAKPEPEKKK